MTSVWIGDHANLLAEKNAIAIGFLMNLLGVRTGVPDQRPPACWTKRWHVDIPHGAIQRRIRRTARGSGEQCPNHARQSGIENLSSQAKHQRTKQVSWKSRVRAVLPAVLSRRLAFRSADTKDRNAREHSDRRKLERLPAFCGAVSSQPRIGRYDAR